VEALETGRATSPSPYYPYWMSDEAREKARERQRQMKTLLLCLLAVAAFLILASCLGAFGLVMGLRGRL
jgi:hypothetical protein